MIKEVIVVEGRDDITAVKKAIDAEIIAVGGFGINAKVIERIKEAQKRKGVIVFTDPDFAGEKIRAIISKRVKGVKHAYIGRAEGTRAKDGNIGVENASPEAIIRALENAKITLEEKREEFTIQDLIYFGLSADPKAKVRRELLGKELRIGYGNANQVLSRLNNYGITKEEFVKAIETGEFDQYLNRVEVKKGDTFFVRSGLVHAICEGVIIAEIQQNSDTTYRVYDYNRGREIHVEKALDCIDFSLKGEKAKGLKVSYDQYDKTYLSLCEYFSLEKYDIHGVCEEESDKERFFIFTCVEGEGIITSEEGELAIKKGDSIFIPASLGKYSLKGNMTLLKSYVPKEGAVEEEILSVVKA